MIEQRRILIVDDDPRVLLVIRTTLDRMNESYKTVTASNGREALEEIKKDTFDLIITDVRMPGINGIKLTEAVRAANTQTSVIWITAYGHYNLDQEIKGLNVFRCLNKPLRIGEIRQTVIKALRYPYDCRVDHRVV
jgi:DNA-binding NtrC family response regulator